MPFIPTSYPSMHTDFYRGEKCPVKSVENLSFNTKKAFRIRPGKKYVRMLIWKNGLQQNQLRRHCGLDFIDINFENRCTPMYVYRYYILFELREKWRHFTTYFNNEIYSKICAQTFIDLKSISNKIAGNQTVRIHCISVYVYVLYCHIFVCI